MKKYSHGTLWETVSNLQMISWLKFSNSTSQMTWFFPPTKFTVMSLWVNCIELIWPVSLLWAVKGTESEQTDISDLGQRKAQLLLIRCTDFTVHSSHNWLLAKVQPNTQQFYLELYMQKIYICNCRFYVWFILQLLTKQNFFKNLS